ncbi:hypothetical protein LCGC14_1344310 [marine sediment metagenome]|uniref:Uncharacterized protein n=1 Tax=marine sediment metagenome TaxID=412755 RepID=A0A0F9KDG1_9ZZZZ
MGSTEIAAKPEHEEMQLESSIRQTIADIDRIRAFIKEGLKEGFDHAKIKGTPRPTLLQPGAEKVCLYLGVRPHYEIKTCDLGNGHVEYEVTCVLISRKTGEPVSEGVASASTMESKHRYRYIPTTDRPEEDEGKILKAKGLGKYQKDYHDQWVWMERIENPNPWDVRHTVKLMGCKRANVKAVRTLAALSEIFAQDLEDFPSVAAVEPSEDVAEAPQGRVIREEVPDTHLTEAIGEPPQAAAKPPEPKRNGKKTVTVRFEGNFAFISGDTYDIKRQISQGMSGKWQKESKEWKVASVWVSCQGGLEEVCQENRIELVEQQETPAS